MDSDKNGNAGEIKETDSGCGPGCDCGKPAGNNKIKTIAILIVVLAVCGIFIYKATTTSASKQTNMNVSASSGFKTPVSSEKTDTSATSVQPAVKSSDAAVTDKVTPDAKKSDTPVPGKNDPKNENSTATPSAETQQPAAKATEDKKMLGDFLDSFSSLNKMAVNQDVVFILIPDKDDTTVKKETSDAVIAAGKTLKSRGLKLGLYTLKMDSPDYENYSVQAVGLPCILVLSKGHGVEAVSEDITEETLLQAYVASSTAGACGPSGCGPSGCGE